MSNVDPMAVRPPTMPPAMPAMKQPQDVAAVVPYATPFAYQQSVAAQMAWREGSMLIVPTQAELPQLCAKCNAPAQGEAGSKRIRQKLAWHHPALFLLIFAGLLIYVIVALVVQKKATVGLSLCREHAARRFRGLLVAWGSVVGGLAITVFGCAGGVNYAQHNDMWPAFVILGGILLAVIGGVAGMLFARVFTAQKIDDRFAWLKGAGPDFLSNFPAVQRP